MVFPLFLGDLQDIRRFKRVTHPCSAPSSLPGIPSSELQWRVSDWTPITVTHRPPLFSSSHLSQAARTLPKATKASQRAQKLKYNYHQGFIHSWLPTERWAHEEWTLRLTKTWERATSLSVSLQYLKTAKKVIKKKKKETQNNSQQQRTPRHPRELTHICFLVQAAQEILENFLLLTSIPSVNRLCFASATYTTLKNQSTAALPADNSLGECKYSRIKSVYTQMPLGRMIWVRSVIAAISNPPFELFSCIFELKSLEI